MGRWTVLVVDERSEVQHVGGCTGPRPDAAAEREGQLKLVNVVVERPAIRSIFVFPSPAGIATQRPSRGLLCRGEAQIGSLCPALAGPARSDGTLSFSVRRPRTSIVELVSSESSRHPGREQATLSTVALPSVIKPAVWANDRCSTPCGPRTALTPTETPIPKDNDSVRSIPPASASRPTRSICRDRPSSGVDPRPTPTTVPSNWKPKKNRCPYRPDIGGHVGVSTVAVDKQAARRALLPTMSDKKRDRRDQRPGCRSF